MQPLQEPISVRVARVNAEIIGKVKTQSNATLLRRETILDALQILYDECSLEHLQKSDNNIADFVRKYKNAIKEMGSLRVNLSDFEIKKLIGCGHFGEVYVVKEKQTGDIYAMKTIRKFDNETKRISFKEERNIMAFSNSPWLTSLQYSFQDSSSLFFVMDYHPGGDLSGLLYKKGGTLPETAALFYLAEIVLALEDLHALGYVHRDIKPDNILLDRCGHLKLADFGSAAKLDKEGMVKMGPPIGTPDYIAPEVLQCLDNKSDKNAGYGISCDFWSLGVLAFELTIGYTPFRGQNSTAIYSKIMNHTNHLKFPPDAVLSQGFVQFIRGLLTDTKTRLKPEKIKSHAVFKTINFDTIRNQVPPHVPKITSDEDTSNFSDVQVKKKNPSVENFKKRSHFSGRNLPFIGFTFTHDYQEMFETNFRRRSIQKSEMVETLKTELENLRMIVSKNDDLNQEKQAFEKKVDDMSIKMHGLEALRDKLEKQLAEAIAESTAVKRTLEMERKERTNLEKKALDLIKGAKLKWELSEKSKVDALDLEIRQMKAKIEQLNHTNQMLDEQLQHARKMEEQNRQSLETEHNLSRRSVMGLENLLEKVNSERQNKISDLQSKLKEEVCEKSDLRIQISTLEKTLENKQNELDNMHEKLATSRSEHESLTSKLHENENLIQQLSSKLSELEKDLERVDGYESEIKTLTHLFEDSQKTIKDLQNKSVLLQNECTAIDKLREENQEIQQKWIQAQSQVADLEKKLEQEKEECDTLKKRLEEAESTESKTQELREKQLQFYKLQKELSNCTIDKRILERELKSAKAEIKELYDKLENSENVLAQNKKTHEMAMLELSGINENISMELIKFKESKEILQEQLKNEKNKIDDEKMIVKELKGFLNSKEEMIHNLEKQLGGLKNEVAGLNTRCKKEESEKSKLMALIEQLQKEKCKLNETIDKAKADMANMNINLDALREACTLLEGQVTEYEKLVAMSRAKQSELAENTEKLIGDLCEARKETQEAKRHINEQKSLRAVAEQRIKRLEEDIQCLEKECADYKSQCMEYKQFSSGLSDELTGTEEKLSNAEVAMKGYERQIEALTAENNLLKEEISNSITEINHLKESKYRLSHQVKDLNQTVAGLLQKIEDLERTFVEKMSYYNEREIKADARDKQHLKLIDYLHSKIEEQSHKKKPLTGIFFGSSKKENQPPISLALNYKDLETELIKEKQNNKKLKEEVFKLKAATVCEMNSSTMEKFGKMEKSKSEILTPRSKAALDQIACSPASQNAELLRQNPEKRMHHNIPHRFDTKRSTTSQVCAQCHNQIPIGRNYHVCKECKTVAHVICSSVLPKVCGLPKEFADHYRETLKKEIGSSNGEMSGKNQMQEAVCEGWIKMPCSESNSWEKRYARLTHSSLDIYSEQPSENLEPLGKFPLKPDKTQGKIVLEPLQSEIGVPVAYSDLPFIIKVELTSETTCWPSKSVVIMTLSANEKDSWLTALQQHFDTDFNSKLEAVVKIPHDLAVNCLLDLTENIKVLGTDKGLFACQGNTLLHIEGLTRVEQISHFSIANIILMIAGPKSTLVACDINHLINLTQCSSCIKPVLNYKDINVNNLNGFHILQVSKHKSQKEVAVATSKQLIILEYYFGTNEFVPIRVLDTAQPTSCILFTENSLIVGADKFFEIDLKSFQGEEFLDASDVNLKQASKCYEMGSFPIGILQVSVEPKEFLLTYNEFSVFVDEFGRSTRRKEIRNEHLPLAVHLAKRYLYTVQFGAVEILKLTEETCNSDVFDLYRLELPKFKYLGANSHGIYLEQDWEVKFLTVRNLPDFDAVSIVTESSETQNDSTNSRFSFTSSMVQSLDGNLSDSTNSDHPLETVRRKVTFDQTDF